MKSYMDADSPLSKQIRETVYAKPALPPASPWLGSKRPAPPTAEVTAVSDGRLHVSADPHSLTDVRHWVVQIQQAGVWSYRIVPASQHSTELALPDPEADVDWVVVSSVSRTGVQSAHKTLLLRLNDILEVVEVGKTAVEEEVAEEAEEAAEDVTK